MQPRRLALACAFFAVLLALAPLSVPAQTAASAAEQGSFVLHKFARAIGKESYTISSEKGQLVLRSDFSFKDRGTEVPLKT